MAAKRKSRKKRKKKNQVQVPFPALLANVLVLVAVLGLSYMWLCSRCDALGKEIKSKEHELNRVNKRLDIERNRWSMITSPPNLKAAIVKHRLDMVMPRESQIIKVGNRKYSDKTAMLGNP
ncbi:MAG: hypothetical protein HKP10_06095 [Kiritimatiellales bacterium]|nr:hypothetical protein [Kiritimatiellales bacterium]